MSKKSVRNEEGQTKEILETSENSDLNKNYSLNNKNLVVK